jgi:hypothetical protein
VPHRARGWRRPKSWPPEQAPRPRMLKLSASVEAWAAQRTNPACPRVIGTYSICHPHVFGPKASLLVPDLLTLLCAMGSIWPSNHADSYTSECFVDIGVSPMRPSALSPTACTDLRLHWLWAATLEADMIHKSMVIKSNVALRGYPCAILTKSRSRGSRISGDGRSDRGRPVQEVAARIRKKARSSAQM